MNVLAQPLLVFFGAAQAGYKPVRALGGTGTPDDPVFFDAGDTVPWWLECRWPLNASFTFLVDCETFWLDGCQHVYPLAPLRGCLMHCDPQRPARLVIVGAPTFVHFTPRPRRPQRKPAASRLAWGAA
jgi:hypothetical protein